MHLIFVFFCSVHCTFATAGGNANTVSQQQLTPPQGWKSPFTFTMGQQSRSVGHPRSFRHPHQNLHIPKSIFKKPVQLGRLQLTQQLKARESNFSAARSLAATPLKASHSGIGAAPNLTSASLVLSRPTAVQHAPAEILQRYILAKQAQLEQRAQHDSQIRTLATSGNDATSLSAPAAEHTERSSDEAAEQGTSDVSLAFWERAPAYHGCVQDSDYERLPALPSSTAVGAAPSATAVMGTDVLVANTTDPDTVHAEVASVEPTVAVSPSTGADTVLPDLAAATTAAAEAQLDNAAAVATTAAAVATTAAEIVPSNVAAGDTSSADAQHVDTARTTAAIDRSAAAPLAVDKEAVRTQQSPNLALKRQHNLLRAAAKAQASGAADAAADSGTGGCESSTGGGRRAADNSLSSEGHMASAAVTGGYGGMQQASWKNVGHGSAEPGKMGIEPFASFPGPPGQASPSICLPFPLLPFSGGMGCHGQPAFVPDPAAAVAAALVKQKAAAKKARPSQRAAEKAARQAAEEAAALQRVLGGKQT